MRLVLFDDLRGLWLSDAEGERNVDGSRSSLDILVTDGAGRVLSGTVLAAGAPHEVNNGRCKLLTEHFSKYGFTTVEFISSGGVRRCCTDIRRIVSDGAWRMPSPAESVSDKDILSLLGLTEMLKGKLEAASALCSPAVSDVLGI